MATNYCNEINRRQLDSESSIASKAFIGMPNTLLTVQDSENMGREINKKFGVTLLTLKSGTFLDSQ